MQAACVVTLTAVSGTSRAGGKACVKCVIRNTYAVSNAADENCNMSANHRVEVGLPSLTATAATGEDVVALVGKGNEGDEVNKKMPVSAVNEPMAIRRVSDSMRSAAATNGTRTVDN